MIDFQNKSFLKMKQDSSYSKKVGDLIVQGEEVLDSYKSMRDGVVFTTMRIIVINVQGMTGKKVDYLDLGNKVDIAYGVTVAASEYKYYLFIGDYVITNEGNIYQIDGITSLKMCQTVEGHIREFNELFYVVNHRYLSIIDGVWDSTYMTESKWQSPPVENVSMYGNELLNSLESESIEIEILNSLNNEIQFGSALILEVEIDTF